MKTTDEKLREIAEAATPGLEWFADMDHYRLVGQPPGSCFINEQQTLALCATGEHAGRVVHYLAEVQPSAVLSLLDRALAAEADAASWKADAGATHLELVKARAEVAKLRRIMATPTGDA